MIHPLYCLVESAMFDALTLHPTMPIETFHSQVVGKGSRLDKPEKDLTSKFISGLPQHLAFFVRAGNPRCLQDAFQQAKFGEAYSFAILSHVPPDLRMTYKDHSRFRVLQPHRRSSCNPRTNLRPFSDSRQLALALLFLLR